MTLENETINFFIFVGIGMLYSILFDVFRALRRVRKTNTKIVLVQDIMYFLIIGVILVITIINFVKEMFRFYYIIGIILGITCYIGIIGNHIMNLFVNVFKAYDKLYQFIILPLEPYKSFFKIAINNFKKFVIKYCKKISYMINFYYSKMKNVLNCKSKTKEG